MEEMRQFEPQGEGAGQTTEGAKTFDEILMDKTYQSEFDKRVAKALETARGKWAQELAGIVRTAEAKARAQAEEQAKELIESERRALAEEKAQFELDKRMAATERMLAKSNLPVAFAGYLLADTEEDIQKNVSQFAELYRGSIERDINHKLRGAAPKSGGGAKTDPLREVMGLK